jgi:hypothetical protein
MKIMNYQKLMPFNPTSYGKIVNSKNQEIEFYEHPIYGDEYPIIAVCHALGKAEVTDFFEIDDMVEPHKEYEPWFDESGELNYG